MQFAFSFTFSGVPRRLIKKFPKRVHTTNILNHLKLFSSCSVNFRFNASDIKSNFSIQQQQLAKKWGKNHRFLFHVLFHISVYVRLLCSCCCRLNRATEKNQPLLHCTWQHFRKIRNFILCFSSLVPKYFVVCVCLVYTQRLKLFRSRQTEKRMKTINRNLPKKKCKNTEKTISNERRKTAQKLFPPKHIESYSKYNNVCFEQKKTKETISKHIIDFLVYVCAMISEKN